MEFRQLARTVGHSVGKKIHPVPIPHNVDELPTLRRTVRVPAGQLAGDLAVPALLRSLCFAPSVELLADPRLPLQPLGTVVTSQAWELVESVGSADATTFRLDARIVFLKRDGAGLHATVECTLVVDGAGVVDGGDAGATLCYRECTSYLDKSGRGAAESVGEVPDLMSLVPNLRTRFGTNGAGRLDVGQARAEVTERFDASAAKQWARLTGDINPIHVSQAAARMLGYKSTILHGAAIDAWATGRLRRICERAVSGRCGFQGARHVAGAA